MRLFARQPTTIPAENPLVPVVRPLSPKGKQSLYAAANSGALKRRTWDGCAFNLAGNLLGESVQSRRRAAQVFDTMPTVVSHFISVWDQLPGSNEACTQLLRDAIEEVGLFTEPEPTRSRSLAGSVWSLF